MLGSEASACISFAALELLFVIVGTSPRERLGLLDRLALSLVLVLALAALGIAGIALERRRAARALSLARALAALGIALEVERRRAELAFAWNGVPMFSAGMNYLLDPIERRLVATIVIVTNGRNGVVIIRNVIVITNIIVIIIIIIIIIIESFIMVVLVTQLLDQLLHRGPMAIRVPSLRQPQPAAKLLHLLGALLANFTGCFTCCFMMLMIFMIAATRRHRRAHPEAADAPDACLQARSVAML